MERLAFGANSGSQSRLLPGDFAWHVEDDTLHLESPGIRATFHPATHDHLLTRRGFRWINELPYNR